MGKKKRAEIQKKKEGRALKKTASQGLLLIDEQLQRAQNDFKRLEEKQKELEKKMSTSEAPKEELAEHAMELQIMLANQASVTEGLLQSKQIIIDYLKEDGREALVKFFQIKGFVNSQ